MKSKLSIMAVLCAGLLAGSNALANNHTVSVGYAQSKVEDFINLRGVNVQYRYEWDSPLSVIGSFSYLKGDDSYSELDYFTDGTAEYHQKVEAKYYSLMAGPAYRINDYVSLYGLLGVARTKVDGKDSYRTPYGNYAGHYSESKTSFAYGAGVVINPISTLSINIGYEGTRVKYSDDFAINGFNIGIGYRF
ncbi:Ail/Lom family outer membrane beta-barrel protein [Pantoea sp. EKM101V]|uniref:Ail/Lom family outer membrane beta-barrel protein n=1 Tax=Pantoea sp. EKM101V TaxID=1683695 RepID=UPI00142E1B2E|nr:Ail/Lom family outer membrane beta-barrel protein [Pantoea sp. EKM101V]KAF6667322.1 Ail/Lom family outer membrane beta-barrel protein [Pantoea sp. EKM101V]